MRRRLRFSRSRRCLVFLAALLGQGLGLGCSELPGVVIVGPAHGTFSTASEIMVTGLVTSVEPANAQLLVNGAPVVVDSGGGFSTMVPLDAAIVFNPIRVDVTDTSNGFQVTERIVVIAGGAIADGSFSPESIALRINDTGLQVIEGVVSDLVDFDPSNLIAVGTEVLDECIVEILVCLGSARVTVVNPPPSVSGFGIGMDSMTDFVAADVLITDLDVHLDIDGSGIVPDCGLRIRADTTDIFGDYGLSPDAVDPSTVDVDQLGGVGVVFGNFDDDLSGICDVPIIGDIIQLFLPDIESLFTQGFVDLLADPDGAGPQDAVIADAIEMALLGVEISGPVGESLGVMLETPIFEIPEDDDGLTLGSDTRITSEIGGGPGQCTPPPGAPDLLGSFHVDEPFPAFGPTTPGGDPYDLGICISTSAFNQLLKAQIECGLLQVDLTEFDLGFGPVPLTTGVLAVIIPELSVFPPDSPLTIALRPTLAPLLTGAPGPNGEMAELRIGQLLLELRDPTPGVDQPLLVAAIDFRAGLELLIDDATDQLAPTVSTVAPGDVTVDIIENLVGTNEATLVAALPLLLSAALPELGSGLGAFPIPGFLDLELEPVEISRQGEFMSIFANLSVPLLLNGSMEDPADLPLDGEGWELDPFTIVTTENGITPQNGASMLRFDATDPSGAGVAIDAEAVQNLGLAAFAAQIATGTAVFQTTAFFNRVDFDAETDTQFRVVLHAIDAGAGVLASVDAVYVSDADPSTWEQHQAALLLPVGTASVQVQIGAREDVFDDLVAPELDGHYADNARALLLPPVDVLNAGMEDGGDVFDDGAQWEGDLFSIAGAENGVAPRGGSSMMRFDATEGALPGSAGASTVAQTVDLSAYATIIDTGTASVRASAFFNRVDFDVETDTSVVIFLRARDSSSAVTASQLVLLASDGDVGTWEELANTMALPAGSTSLEIQLIAVENVVNDTVAPEFDGHYADDVAIRIEP